MRAGSVGQRQAQSDMVNMNKRVNNKAQDQNREMNIRNASATRRQNRNAKQAQTGIPIRAVQGPAQ
jgi:hypothetical protein